MFLLLYVHSRVIWFFLLPFYTPTHLYLSSSFMSCMGQYVTTVLFSWDLGLKKPSPYYCTAVAKTNALHLHLSLFSSVLCTSCPNLPSFLPTPFTSLPSLLWQSILQSVLYLLSLFLRLSMRLV